MAKGNMLQGQATGKVGDIVFMVRNGQQVARVYTSAGGRSGDQASIAVRRQRVRFGAASNQYLAYRNIVRGMYRTGKSTKQSDYNFFVRENVDLLPFLTKEENAAGVKCAMPGTFSRGTLGSLNYDMVMEELTGSGSLYRVTAAGSWIGNSLNWTDTVSELKTALKSALPNARKVTYAVIKLVRNDLETPAGPAYSHTFVRYDVIFDLYEEDPDIADSATIAEYFDYYCTDSEIMDVFDAQKSVFCNQKQIFSAALAEGEENQILQQLYVLVFATNDQVGDAYTSSLTSITSPDTDGYLSLYSTLRTADHQRVAEDSYGYATGVMRTSIQQA